MANIKINGNSTLNNIVCFSYAPTILELSSNTGGSYTIHQFDFDSTFSGIGYSDNYYIKINNVTLNRVSTISQAKGYYFYMTDTSDAIKQKLMLETLADAIKRIPEVLAGYEAYVVSDNDGKRTNRLMIKSIELGNNTPLTIEHNIPFLKQSTQTGTASTEFKDGSVNIEIYKMANAAKPKYTTTLKGTYITTLSKHTANDEKVRFDLSPIFASLTNDGEVGHFNLFIYNRTDTAITEIQYLDKIYNVNGYLINQGGEYISELNSAKIALNAQRGTNRDFLNNTILYVYDQTIPVSVYATNGVNVLNYKIKYVGSDTTTLIEVEKTANLTKPLNHLDIELSANYLSQAKYVDIVFTSYNLGTLRFNVIKPIRATDECQRVYWYNSWGGISFFDFTGNRTEERKVTNTTYQDSILNYYDNDINEREYVYEKENEITVKLTTHNIVKDAQWHLFDLQQSRNAWTYINGEKYRIIVSDLTITETSVTDIYTATIEYTYSMGVNV